MNNAMRKIGKPSIVFLNPWSPYKTWTTTHCCLSTRLVYLPLLFLSLFLIAGQEPQRFIHNPTLLFFKNSNFLFISLEMSLKATALFLLTVSALLALVKSAPASHSLYVRQYSGQNMTNNSTNTPSTPANTNASDFVKQSGLAAQKLNSEFAAINVTDPCQGSFYLTLVCLPRIY